jgi:hypothetical protein
VTLEWHAKSDFEAFLVSSELQSMIGASKAFMAGPPTIQLFETDASPASSATAPLTIIVRTTIKDPGNREAAGKVWSGLVKDIGGEAKGFTHGASVNLEEELYLGVLGWESMEVGSHR